MKALKWCVMHQMKKRPLRSRQPIPAEKVERISLSLAAEDKSALERIAFEKRVSIAWVIRDAVTRYLEQSAENSLGAEKPRID